jgi:hypothetical protein
MPKSTALGLKQEKNGARLCQRGACPKQNPANEPQRRSERRLLENTTRLYRIKHCCNSGQSMHNQTRTATHLTICMGAYKLLSTNILRSGQACQPF